ncbi:MAG TPA: LysR family transcriptional regulator [Polyangia bacterium]|nr:LysR family transcriptional regulator [Polyangia bacterium]
MAGKIDPKRLETFRVVASVGKITAASQQLHLSQPAVTAQLRQLEEQVGQPLFVRGARGVALTDAGRELLDYAQRLNRLLEDAETAMLAPGTTEGPGAELALAASTTIASYLLPSLLASFLRRRPGLGVRLEVGNTEQVLGWLRDAKVPLGLVEGHARAGGMHLTRFVGEELVAVVGAAAPPAFLRVRKPADLAHVPIIWREPGSGTRAVVERALRQAGARRGSHAGDLQLGGTEAIKAAVALGLGVGILSRWSIQSELALGRLRVLPIRGLTIERHFSWVLPVDGAAGIAGEFLRHARAEPPLL